MACCRDYKQTKEPQPVNIKVPSEETNENHYDIGTYDSAPHYIRDNEYIKRGYRNNFNSFKKIVKSLFMIHNESVNVWTHLLGLIFVFVLFFYTALYISHHTNIVHGIENKYKEIKEDLGVFVNQIPTYQEISDNIGEKYEHSKQYIHEIASSVSNKTKDYLHIVDDKLGEYKDFIKNKLNCIDCIKDLIATISNLESIKENLINESKNLIHNLEELDLKERLDALNSKMIKFKDELLEKLESKEMDWIDIYKTSEMQSDSKVKKWPLFVLLFGAVACLAGSTIFHLFAVHSERWNELLSRLDYAGISLLILGSCYPPYYYYYFCLEGLRNFYLTFMTIFSVSVFVVSLTDGFNMPHKRKLRGFLFLFLGISAGGPICHLFFLEDNPGMVVGGDYSFWFFGGVAYIGGALLYIWRFPEKYWPGKFCLFGSSHQIWHCFVVAGIVFHYFGSLKAYHERLGSSHCSR